MVVKTKMICNMCKKPACFYNGKWWCAHTTAFGNYNIYGACKTKKYREDDKDGSV